MVRKLKSNIKGYGANIPTFQASPEVIVSNRAPTTSDVGFDKGQMWIDETDDSLYVLVNIAAGVANWDSLNNQGDEPITRYVVAADGTGDYTTIQLALTAKGTSTGKGIIYVKDGTYTENLVIPINTTIEGSGKGSTTIVGLHTPGATGYLQFKNIALTSATDILFDAGAGSATLLFNNVIFTVTNGMSVNCAAWTGATSFYNCFEGASTTNSIIDTAGHKYFYSSYLGAGATPMTHTGAGKTLQINDSTIGIPINISATGATIFKRAYTGLVTTTANTTLTAEYTRFYGSAGNCISHGSANNIYLYNCILSTTGTAIGGAGAGTIYIEDVTYTGSAALGAGLTYGSAGGTLSANVVAHPGGDVTVSLGDAAGANKLKINQDDFVTNIASIDSLGRATFNTSVISPLYTAPAATDLAITAVATKDINFTMSGDHASGRNISISNVDTADIFLLTAAGRFEMTGTLNTAPSLVIVENATGDDMLGTATLVAGSKVVATTAATASCKIYLTRKTLGGNPGHLSYTVNAGVSFTITSSDGADVGEIDWLIIKNA